jgi:hypothetical protein
MPVGTLKTDGAYDERENTPKPLPAFSAATIRKREYSRCPNYMINRCLKLSNYPKRPNLPINASIKPVIVAHDNGAQASMYRQPEKCRLWLHHGEEVMINPLSWKSTGSVLRSISLPSLRDLVTSVMLALSKKEGSHEF